MAFKFNEYHLGGGGSGGGSAVLTELTVTENGVYDEPMIGGGPVEIAVGKTVQFKKHITMDDIPEHLRPTEGENSYGQIVRDDFTNSGYNIGAETVAIELVISEPESLAGVYGYFDEATALAYGVTPGWNRIVDAENIESLDVPPSILVANATSAEQLSEVSFFFEGAPTPADGWNKVTVNVAGDIINVPELPTENIEDGKIYKVTKETEESAIIYAVNVQDPDNNIVYNGDHAELSKNLMEQMGLTVTTKLYVVDALPNELEAPIMDMSNRIVEIVYYVLRGTGESYQIVANGGVGMAISLNEMTGASHHGIIFDPSEATEDGFYTIMIPAKSSTTYGIPNNATVQRFVDGAWVELA